MASTNHTSRLGLNQWTASDPVLREDFNADNTRLEQLVPRFTYGSYTGNGTIGGTNQLTFPFPPKLVVIMGDRYSLLWVLGATYANTSASGSSLGDASVSCSGNTLTWVMLSSSGTATFQMNKSDTQYFYFALG